MPSFDEYKLFVEQTQKLSERRQKANEIYLAINTGIFTILAFFVRDSGFSSWRLFLFSLPLLLVGVLICFVWHRIIRQFRALIGWRYEQLRMMEDQIPGSFLFITKEWDAGYAPRGGRERFGFARLEIWTPQLVLLLYFIYIIGSLVVATFR